MQRFWGTGHLELDWDAPSRRPEYGFLGQTMAGRGLLKYHIVGTLWVGRSSIIYRATDPHNTVVAIKMLLPDTKGNRRALREMEHEARYTLQLDHPNIVQAIEYVRDAPMPALILEYFSTENLKTSIVRSEDFIHQHAHRIVVQVCEALGYVHQSGLIHRDIKPENVLVAPDGAAKLIDFALAEPFGRKWSLSFLRRRISGTRPYIAPETIRRQPPDPRTDIYSLGVTIYEMLTGRPPFSAGDRDILLRKHLSEQPTYMRASHPNISLKMDELVMQMLRKKPHQRPENCEEIVARMQDIRVFDS